MKVSKKIRDLIMSDNAFSLELAACMGIQQASLRNLVRRESAKLTLYQCVEFYKSKGLTQEEIFEAETVNQ